jgi:hypothetical protein
MAKNGQTSAEETQTAASLRRLPSVERVLLARASSRKLGLVERAARQARNEALHREVNERIAQMDKRADVSWATHDETFEFLCECGAGAGCDARVRMTLPEYEHVVSRTTVSLSSLGTRTSGSSGS